MTHPFQKSERRTKSSRARAEFFASRGGLCANCKRKIRPGENWDIDHIVSLENQGTNDDSNLQLLCQNCHGAKTKVDRKEAANNRRKFTKNIVPKKHKRTGFRGWKNFRGEPVWNDNR